MYITKAGSVGFTLLVPISQADTVVDVGTVMVELGDAAITDSAVLCSERPDDATGVAEP